MLAPHLFTCLLLEPHVGLSFDDLLNFSLTLDVFWALYYWSKLLNIIILFLLNLLSRDLWLHYLWLFNGVIVNIDDRLHLILFALLLYLWRAYSIFNDGFHLLLDLIMLNRWFLFVALNRNLCLRLYWALARFNCNSDLLMVQGFIVWNLLSRRCSLSFVCG